MKEPGHSRDAHSRFFIRVHPWFEFFLGGGVRPYHCALGWELDLGWSEQDQAYIGRCPDLFHGGAHGTDPLRVAGALQKVIDEWESILESDARPMPPVRVKPTMEWV